MSARATLEQAHALIQQKNYREARLLLAQIAEHPTAAKWIARIDELTDGAYAPSTASRPTPGAAKTRSANPKPAPAKTHSADRPNLISALYVGFGTMLVLFFVFGLMRDIFVDYFNPLITFADDRVTFLYPAEWEPQEITNHGYCRDVYDECLIYIKTSPNVGFLVNYIPLNNYQSARELAEAEAGYGLADPIYQEFDHEYQEFSLGGFPAVALLHRVSEKDENGGEFYMVDILVADGLDSYIINLLANNACNLNRRINDINAMLSTLRFSSTNVALAEDGYTPPSEVRLTIPACQ
jgi:hypothetical protein